jgi:hypothetical protein
VTTPHRTSMHPAEPSAFFIPVAEQRPNEQPDSWRVEAPLPVRLFHQLEGHRGDQHPRPYGHHHGDDPPGGAAVETEEHPTSSEAAPTKP